MDSNNHYFFKGFVLFALFGILYELSYFINSSTTYQNAFNICTQISQRENINGDLVRNTLKCGQR